MSGAKILIVEDEWLVAQGISENLKDLGYEVAGLVSSGEEALRLAAENQPDLVLMDILLKADMDGIETAEHLRRGFNIPVVFLTAYADPQTLERAKVAEPYGYILKPFELRELHSAIEIALYKNRAEKRLQHLTEVLRAIRSVNQLIVQEKDRDRLIEKACQLLTEGRGYFTAWIALTGEGEKVAAFAIAGEECDTSPLCHLLQKGEMAPCGCWALKQKGLVVIEDLSPQSECFLWKNYQDRGELVIPLAHQNHGHGVLGVLLPGSLSRDEEELSLFQELAADLSLALYNLDLEEREQHIQEALRASEEKFRQLVENANQIILVAQGGRIRFANPLAIENSGYSLEELTSRPFLEFVHPDDREMVMKAYTDRLQGREVPNDYVCRYFSKNGALHWAEIKTSDITWEGEPATLNCISDITERKEMEEALQQNEEKFRMFFEKAPIGYHSLDEQGCIQEVNPTWLKTLGYTREEVMGRWIGDFLIPEYREPFSARFGRFKTIGEFSDVTADMVKKDGSVITVSFNGTVARDDEERFLRTHCVFTDITIRLQAEFALKESEERYRTVADFTYDMEYWLGPDQRLIYISPSCERLTGYTREEFFQDPKLKQQIVHPEDRGRFSEHRKKAQDCSHALNLDFRLIHRDGWEIWVSHTCQPVYGLDGRYLGRRVSNSDITERKQAEEALQKNEERFRLLFNNVSDAVFVHEVSADTFMPGRFIEVNDIACQYLGYSREELLQMSVPQIDAPEILDNVPPIIRKLFAEGRAMWEGIHLSKDGRRIPVEISNQLFELQGKQIVFSSVRNISERKRAELELRDSEERFRQLVENAPDAILIQTEGQFAYLNKEALRLFGATTDDQLLGQPVMDRFHPDFRDIVKERIRLLNEERKAVPRLEQQYLKLDGTPFDVEVSAVPFRFQKKNGALVFFRDITERKRAEEAVKEGTQLNQTLLDSLPCVAMLLRPRTREIVAANEVAIQVGAVPGAFCYATWAQRQDPCPFCLAPQLWKTGQAQHLEVEYGGVFWDAHWIPIKEDLYLHYAFDITARKQVEKERKMLEAQLFQAQKMEALGTLAGGIAHDFNNILGAMLGFAELVYIGVPQSSKERTYLEDLLKAGERARHLVKHILSFSRQEKAVRQPLALTQIIKETLKFLRASLPTTIEIRTRLKAEKAMVMADPTQIHQVLLNLATNATHAMEERGGVLEVSLEEIQLTPGETALYEGVRPGPYQELRVSDTGHGMEPEVLERIFDPFFTTKEPGKGTGMGLAVVYGIIKDHGGAIRVTSQPGMGTTFQVLLPVLEVKLSDVKPEVLTPLSRGVGRILFVDDDADFFQAGQRMLARLGYEVAAYDSSLKALEEFKAQPHRFDLIISDQTMPGLTGLELAASCFRVRADIPFILSTGFSQTVTPEKVRAIGIKEVVTKPFNLHQIGEIIKKVLKKNKPGAE